MAWNMMADFVKDRIYGDVKSTEPTDMFGSPFRRLDVVAKAMDYPRSGSIQVVQVRKIDGGKIFLGNSTIPVRYPGRLVNLSSLPGHIQKATRVIDVINETREQVGLLKEDIKALDELVDEWRGVR